MAASPAKRGPGRPRGNAKLTPVRDPEPGEKRGRGRPPGTGLSLKTISRNEDSSRLDVLRKMRELTAEQLDAKPPAAAFASLSKRFTEVDAEIRALEAKIRRDSADDSDADDEWNPETL